MDSSLRTSASGMMAQQRMVDVIANNIANVNTTGFKRSRVSFEDVLYQTIQGPRAAGAKGESLMSGVQVGKGVRLAAITRIHEQGAAEQTDRPLDMAIDGEGFFQVEMPDGSTAYTRDGTFQLSSDGTLVTHGGRLLQPNVVIPSDASNITISSNGSVSVTAGNSSTSTEVGRIELARFVNPSGLQALGENLYSATPASGEPITGFPQEEGTGRILQGTLESSNVEVVQEMTDMIAAQRAYEINSRAVSAGEEMMQATNDLLR